MIRVVAILLALTEIAGACAQPQLFDEALTADGATIPDGGGVVIATRIGGNGTDEEEGRSLVAGGRSAVGANQYIAPGLRVLVPRRQPGATFDLVNMRGKTLRTFVQGDIAPKHLAPKLVSVTSSLPEQPKVRRKTMWPASGELVVTLDETAPADVLALVVRTTGKDAVGIAWAAPSTAEKTYRFQFGGKRCSPGPGGVEQGTKVTVAWLDRSGRLSVLTKEVAVRKPDPLGSRQ